MWPFKRKPKTVPPPVEYLTDDEAQAFLRKRIEGKDPILVSFDSWSYGTYRQLVIQAWLTEGPPQRFTKASTEQDL